MEVQLDINHEADKSTLSKASKISRRMDAIIDKNAKAKLYFEEMTRRKLDEVREKTEEIRLQLVKQDSTSSESSMASGASGSSSFSEDPVVLFMNNFS